MSDAPRVLLVEDEPVTLMMLEQRLRAAGCSVRSATSGEAALALLREARFALMITDLHLDALDGVTLMAEARTIDPELELIVLTGGATLASAVAAVNHHAHAYLLKPVAPGALESSVAAALEHRRSTVERNLVLRQVSAALQQLTESPGPGYGPFPAPQPALQIGHLTVDPARRRACIGGQSLVLSSSDFELLLLLAERAEQVVPSDTIARALLHYSCGADEARELLKKRVHRLRARLAEDARTAHMLVCVRGVGYMLTAGH